jgi:putative DNA primase/helicase
MTNVELDAKIIDLDTKRELDEPRPPAFSDEALALRFAEFHANDLRYVAAWGRWLSWDGISWQIDNTLAAYNLARKICRIAAAQCNKPRIQAVLASAKTVAAVERLAKADRRIAATVDQWDTDPWFLNTPGGVIDLRTGERRLHNPRDYITKTTAVAPDSDCTTPTWDAFLDRVTGGNAELVAAGNYHRTAPIETFTAAQNERHPTDLAGLRGSRLVTSVETEEGRRWAESKIKTLTGGDKIAARFMRQDFFEFVPNFKLLIAGNHKPGLRSVDEAIRRRFHLVPFNVVIPPEQRDKSLGDRLRTEWPGILAWMIDGCIEWQECGLASPEAVTSATAAYLEAEDAIAAWIEDAGTHDQNAWEKTATLFAKWRAWADNAGEYAGTRKGFSEKIEARGLVPERKSYGRGFSWLQAAH